MGLNQPKVSDSTTYRDEEVPGGKKTGSTVIYSCSVSALVCQHKFTTSEQPPHLSKPSSMHMVTSSKVQIECYRKFAHRVFDALANRAVAVTPHCVPRCACLLLAQMPNVHCTRVHRCTKMIYRSC
ncbi:hypothetical protein J3458_019110 [Metarhizium acridum]|uniref:uncharacterized protein n=1 Tax=Metarhizium acridum TaxID=92637 RepID=UPI001C6C4829|nr:hypothetical protein J3458_019110 [Metarhizium acridum]